MKKIFKYILPAVFGVSTLSSCEGFLDTTSSTAVSTSEAITDLSSLNTALIGVYDALQGNSTDTEYYGADFVFFADVQGDLIQARVQAQRSSTIYQMEYTASSAPSIWSVPYNAIMRANNVIEAVDNGLAPDGTTAELNNIKGQAMFIRALAHFDLCRIYSKPYTVDATSMGIPIVSATLAGDEVVNLVSDRGTVADVYAFVTSELVSAAALIDNTAATEGYVNSWACKALLSRVYLYQGENQKALDMAADVINNGPYSLWSNDAYATAWETAGNSEHIFEIVNFDTNDWVDREAIGYLYDEDGYADMVATPKLTEYFTNNPNDVRGGVLLASATASYIAEYGTEKLWINKYPGRSSLSYDTRVANIPVLRLSEVYLNAAEAAQKLGNAAADTYINAIASRNPGVSYTNVTLDQILWERGIELFGEGHRKFDLLRNGQTITRTPNRDYALISGSDVYDVTYYRAILPIPQSEMDANPSMAGQQNAGY